MGLTHEEIVKAGCRWIKRHHQNIKTPNCSLVLSELVTANPTGEIPDIIGFGSNKSVLIEVKTNRPDFLRDKKKVFRAFPEMGLGEYRLYLSPPNIIQLEDIPHNWGLLWIGYDKKIHLVRHPIPQVSNLISERAILLSHIRRKK